MSFLNEFDLDNLFDELNKKHFENKINKIPVKWNKRLRTCAGKFHYKLLASEKKFSPIKIELAYKVFELNGWDNDKIETTLAHEMTHAYLIQEYGERGHTQRFHDIMTKITGVRKNHRCHNYNVIKNERKIDVICTKCGHIGTRARMPKAGVLYKHNVCGNKVLFKRINDEGNNFFKI